jgi:hypothetical protein
MKEIEEDTKGKEKETEKKGKISHVPWQEELIWLKCSYYPKQSADSVHSLSKYQFPRNFKNCVETHTHPSKKSSAKKNKAGGLGM